MKIKFGSFRKMYQTKSLMTDYLVGKNVEIENEENLPHGEVWITLVGNRKDLFDVYCHFLAQSWPNDDLQDSREDLLKSFAGLIIEK